MRRLGGFTSAALGVTIALLTAGSAAASATTIGALPTSSPHCEAVEEPFWLAQSSAAGNAYTVPNGGGYLTSWSMAFGAPGSPVGLLVLTPEGGGFLVVGLDSERLPSPIPAGNVSTFMLSTPIPVQAGDTLGLLDGPGGSACFFTTTAPEDRVVVGKGSPAVGATLTPEFPGEKLRLDMRAEVLQSDDASLAQSASPSTITTGGLALVTLEPRLSPAFALPSTIVDTLPTGLSPVAVSATRSCSIGGQTVTCQFSATGEPIYLVVSATAAGVYTNTASISQTLSDPNLANNSATSTITVGAAVASSVPATTSCHPVNLAGVTLAVARKILPELRCTAGKVTYESSSKVARGVVISNSPSSGSVAAGSPVAMTVSSGKAKKHKKKHRRHRKHKH